MANHLPLIAALAAVALCASPIAAATEAQQTGPAAEVATHFSTAETEIGTLLDNPETKAVLEKHIPQFVADPQIAMARSMTLKQIQSFASDVLTDEKLALIDADLAALPASH